VAAAFFATRFSVATAKVLTDLVVEHLEKSAGEGKKV